MCTVARIGSRTAMVRVLLREMVLTLVALVAVSCVAFAVFDTTSHQDWFATAAHAHAVGMSADHLGARDLPLFFNARVLDARGRTERDLRALGDARSRTAAMASLAHRGIAALPYIVPNLQNLSPTVRSAALTVLACEAPTLTGGDHAPTDEAMAVAWWQSFWDVRALDFRQGYAQRIAQRLAWHSSHNASEEITRLGTFALPALFKILVATTDRDAEVRLTNALADITGIPLRATSETPTVERTRMVSAWRAYWFAEHLEYQSLSSWQRTVGKLTETRYGRWLSRALRGRFGISSTTFRPAALELRERLPASVLVSGLGGLLATAVIVAFGGGPKLRRRPLRPKLLDLVGALVPGLTAFVTLWTVLLGAIAPGNALPLARTTLARWPGLATATVLLSLVAGLWLRRPALRLVFHAVRVEAEDWAMEGLSPGLRAVLRHGARIGVASLLAPMGLAAPVVLVFSLVVEPMVGVHGMGALTERALRHMDAPWLMVATLSVVPVLLGRRWARMSLVWLVDPTLLDDPEGGPLDTDTPDGTVEGTSEG